MKIKLEASRVHTWAWLECYKYKCLEYLKNWKSWYTFVSNILLYKPMAWSFLKDFATLFNFPFSLLAFKNYKIYSTKINIIIQTIVNSFYWKKVYNSAMICAENRTTPTAFDAFSWRKVSISFLETSSLSNCSLEYLRSGSAAILEIFEHVVLRTC